MLITFCLGKYTLGRSSFCSLSLRLSILKVGGYLEDVLNILEANQFLNVSMPWSSLSIAHGMARQKSNDGPILWTRPGEQVVPTADLPKSPYKRQKS